MVTSACYIEGQSPHKMEEPTPTNPSLHLRDGNVILDTWGESKHHQSDNLWYYSFMEILSYNFCTTQTENIA
jgi:hypothetical protein